jgi:hypothetical protein
MDFRVRELRDRWSRLRGYVGCWKCEGNRVRQKVCHITIAQLGKLFYATVDIIL